MMRVAILAILLSTSSLATTSAIAADADNRVDYVKQVKSVLAERCYACHGALKQEAGLRLDTAALAIRGGDSGPTIKPGQPDESTLLQRVSTRDEAERMPPEGEPLKSEQIAALRAWIAQNAEAPSDEQPERNPRDHWAFKTPVRPPVPTALPLTSDSRPSERSAEQFKVAQAEQSRWKRNPIDAFVAKGHRDRNLVPQPTSDKRVWLRRVTLDLIGLPPSPEETLAFIDDNSTDAYDKVVTRLLDSPQYGERWGRHWMDIWRYSDWWGLGADLRNSQKHMWHWRDWIIESLNADRPYDQILREMLAADELYPNDLDKLRASGFLARQYFKFNRTSWLDETIEHTAKSMLGLTFNCAKCHDHKYDPLTQQEYYQFRAIFEPYQIRTDMVTGQTDVEQDGIPRAFDVNLDAPTYLLIRGDDRNPDKSKALAPAVPTFLTSAGSQLSIAPITLPPEATQPGLRDFVVDAHRQAADQQVVAATKALTAAKTLLRDFAEHAPSESTPTDEPTTATPERSSDADIVRDDFAAEKPELWEQLAGKWSYEKGRLVQSQAAGSRAVLRLKPFPPQKRELPRNFEARLKYVPTGGDKWKSVGIAFDVTADGNELFAYASSVDGSSKAQLAFKRAGAYVYPAEGAQARPIELNQPHEIVLRARGKLLNMSVDGDKPVALRLPKDISRTAGSMELITFDAQVEFISFQLKPLSDDVKLVEAEAVKVKPAPAAKAATAPPANIEQAKVALRIAETALLTAELRRSSIDARAAADRLRFKSASASVSASAPTVSSTQGSSQSSTDTTLNELLKAAAKSERAVAASIASEEVLRAELAVLQATSEKRAELETKLAAAKTAYETAQKASETPSETYTSLPGAVKTLESNTETEESRKKPFPATSSGRRKALAEWITHPNHPLPARVAVNHIWSRHMGKPLVPTVFDFGRKGIAPSHPELLDWLAVEFIEHGWSMKHIHRLIVTSQTYQLSSSTAQANPSNLDIDPENKFYWRANAVRMEAQTVRDSLLYLAGELDLKLGGPSIPANDENSRRRSLYFVHSHNEHNKFLSMFDDASVLDCYRRSESIVPQQALALENSPLVAQMSEQIAKRLSNTVNNNSAFIEAAFLAILTTVPSLEERELAGETLSQWVANATQKNTATPDHYARTRLIQALLNHNDFVTIR